MGTEITVALIALFGTAIGTGGGILISNKMTTYRIEQLELKMNKHNNMLERVYKLEECSRETKEDVQEIKVNISDISKIVMHLSRGVLDEQDK